MARGFFGNLFDMNRDGKLDAWERAMDMMAFEEMLAEEEQENDDLDDEDDYELEMAGIDPEELEFMDEDERREILEAAGLDPDEYDF